MLSTCSPRGLLLALAMLLIPALAPAAELRLREIKEPPKYGVIRRYKVDPKNIDQIVTRAKSGSLPLVTHLPGFASYSILDAGKETLVTLSGFTAQSGAAESTKAAATFVKENLSSLVPNPLKITSGEIKIMERAR